MTPQAALPRPLMPHLNLPGFEVKDNPAPQLPEAVQEAMRHAYPKCPLEYQGILLLAITHFMPGLAQTSLSPLITLAHFPHLKKSIKPLVEHLTRYEALSSKRSGCYPTHKFPWEVLKKWIKLPLFADLREWVKNYAQELLSTLRFKPREIPSALYQVCRALRLMGEEEQAWELIKNTQSAYSLSDNYISSYELVSKFLYILDEDIANPPQLPEVLQNVLLPARYFEKALDSLPEYKTPEWWVQNFLRDRSGAQDYAAVIIHIALQTGNWELLDAISDNAMLIYINPRQGINVHDIIKTLKEWQDGKWSALDKLFSLLSLDKRSYYYSTPPAVTSPIRALLSPLLFIAAFRLRSLKRDELYEAATWLRNICGSSSTNLFHNTTESRERSFLTEKVTYKYARPLDLLPKAMAIAKRNALPELSPKELNDMYNACMTLRDSGLGLYAFYMANSLLCIPHYSPEQLRELESIMAGRPDLPPFCKVTRLSSSQDKVIEQLEKLLKSSTSPTAGKPARIIWTLHRDKNGDISHFSAQAQKKRTSGNYSHGQKVNISHLFDGKFNDYLTDTEHHFVRATQPLQKNGWYKIDEGAITRQNILYLCGNPHLKLESDNRLQDIELTALNPELTLSTKGKQITLTLEEYKKDTATLTHLGGNRYGVCIIRKEHEQAYQILAEHSGSRKMTFPASYRDKLMSVLTGFSNTFRLKGDLSATSIPPRKAIYRGVVQMQGQTGMLSGALYLELLPGCPLIHFGQGENTYFSHQNGTPILIQRDPIQEGDLLKKLLSHCPTLAAELDADSTWQTPVNDTALAIVEELHACPPELLEVRWPEGERLSVGELKNYSGFNLQVRKAAQDWLSIGGEVQTNERMVIHLAELLRCLRECPGRYIRLNDTHFVRLNRTLERQLRTLSAVVHPAGKTGSKKNQSLISPAALLLMGLADGQEQLPLPLQRKTQEILQQYQASPYRPRNLQATLREYQEEGYRWLQRLMNCGLGACLADDMGLGKTLQVLSVLLARAEDGPSLVITPVSVCNNWVHEAARFTPTLRLQTLGVTDRAQTIKDLKKRDVLVCSYGLLITESKLLTAKQWNVVVLDEAQYIKNDTSQRAKVATELKARCRIAATGTPIENNLTELRSIFDFLNPGLLGNREDFSRRFTSTPEQHKLLRRIVSPFILRRLKNDVLDELPPKTETTLYVTLSEQERALYEATRRTALAEALESENRFTILAQLMKLRRLCCHPQLVLPECGIPSAKLAVLQELAEELRESGHRALIFSQFTDMLTHVRSLFEARGLSYSYLDGSTPQKLRSKAVEQFNGGDTDFFLISLKAGGTGLNLTTADYVILLDPWWNPAVEDQAADRTHRIGQKNPVTICRLVCADTIEERVLTLHKEKRQLVDDVLSGENKVAPLNIHELTELI